ncbi:MAG: hypothetical protein AB1696_25285 [Planctomycetota bacterium]
MAWIISTILTVLSWIVWSIALLLTLFVGAGVVLGGWRHPKIQFFTEATTTVVAAACLIVTAMGMFSRFHLLWVLPVTFFVSRSLFAAVVMSQVRRRAFDELHEQEADDEIE